MCGFFISIRLFIHKDIGCSFSLVGCTPLWLVVSLARNREADSFLFVLKISNNNANEVEIRGEAKYSNFYIYAQQCENCILPKV